MQKLVLIIIFGLLSGVGFSQEKKDSIQPFAPCVEEIYVPNSFNGDGDGINDQFRPVMMGSPKTYSLQIFNRWGELIFETNNVDEGWNGSYKSQPVNMDTYVWMIKITCSGSEEKYTLTGHVTVLR